MPVNETLILSKFMNASANIYMGLIYYLKSISEFNSLPVNTKMSLIKKIHTNCIALSPFVHDPILIRLFIIVLMLSTHMNIRYERNLIANDDEISTRNIFTVLNFYVELLWRYIFEVKIDKFIRTNLPSQNQQLEPIMKSI
ncbi:unnamed protein product [Rotaria sordida]|uniref:Uncharacterized protein n=1 Tax=Rotaria sordida TaxID=392033 RepID=A0A819DEX1_9BILA|nr:unnamed protein product [Rotaria sordida]CAF4020739.1 unnamed protein product [Rotaria sordida]